MGKKGQDDDDVVGSAALMFVGASAAIFGARQARRMTREIGKIKEMWAAKTSIRSLREAAEAGKALPQVCIITGRIGADGAAIKPVTTSVPALQQCIGKINQAENPWIELGKRTRGKEQGATEHTMYQREAEIDPEAANLVLSEMLVTRQLPHVYTKTTKIKNKDGVVTGTRMTMNPWPAPFRHPCSCSHDPNFSP